MKKTLHSTFVTICFDLDQTLIARLREDIVSYLHSRGLAYKKIFAIYLTIANTQFTPQKFAKALGLSKSDTQDLVAYTYSLFVQKQYIYPGGKWLLKKLKKDATLFLVTFGDHAYQMAKIRDFGFEKYFSTIIVTPENGKREIALKLAKQTKGKLIMIDDSRTVERTMKEIGVPFIKVKKSWKDPVYFGRLYTRIKKKIAILQKSS